MGISGPDPVVRCLNSCFDYHGRHSRLPIGETDNEHNGHPFGIGGGVVRWNIDIRDRGDGLFLVMDS